VFVRKTLSADLEHPWPRDCKHAAEIQKLLAGKVRLCRLKRGVKTVGAIDVALKGPVRRQKRMVAGVIVYDVATGKVLERQSVTTSVRFPYVPGFLSFREAPGALEAIAKLSTTPDLFLVDGQGLAHPRFFGLACHIGVLIDHPTVGCAKSLLVGTAKGQLGADRGCWVELEHAGRTVGAVVRTRKAVKPVYVSVGHRITLGEAVDVVLQLAPRYRLPEPARIAHNYVGELTHTSCRASCN